MICTHVLEGPDVDVMSPLDFLSAENNRESAAEKTSEAEGESGDVEQSYADTFRTPPDAHVDELVGAGVVDRRWQRRGTDRSRPTESRPSVVHRLMRWCFGGDVTGRKRGDPAHPARHRVRPPHRGRRFAPINEGFKITRFWRSQASPEPPGLGRAVFDSQILANPATRVLHGAARLRMTALPANDVNAGRLKSRRTREVTLARKLVGV